MRFVTNKISPLARFTDTHRLQAFRTNVLIHDWPIFFNFPMENLCSREKQVENWVQTHRPILFIAQLFLLCLLLFALFLHPEDMIWLLSNFNTGHRGSELWINSTTRLEGGFQC